jgi:hypothetical protein
MLMATAYNFCTCCPFPIAHQRARDLKRFLEDPRAPAGANLESREMSSQDIHQTSCPKAFICPITQEVRALTFPALTSSENRPGVVQVMEEPVRECHVNAASFVAECRFARFCGA